MPGILAQFNELKAEHRTLERQFDTLARQVLQSFKNPSTLTNENEDVISCLDQSLEVEEAPLTKDLVVSIGTGGNNGISFEGGMPIVRRAGQTVHPQSTPDQISRNHVFGITITDAIDGVVRVRRAGIGVVEYDDASSFSSALTHANIRPGFPVFASDNDNGKVVGVNLPADDKPFAQAGITLESFSETVESETTDYLVILISRAGAGGAAGLPSITGKQKFMVLSLTNDDLDIDWDFPRLSS